MALAGDQENIAGAQIGNRCPDCLTPVADFRGAGGGGEDGGADGGWLFAARIIVSDDYPVGLGGGDFTHQRPLAAIAIAAGAENDDKFAARRGPQRVEGFGERVGLVRIVDEDRRAVLHAGKIKPALGADKAFERGEDRAWIAAGADDKSGGDQRVLDLKFTDQRQTDLEFLSGMGNAETLRETIHRGIDEREFRHLRDQR